MKKVPTLLMICVLSVGIFLISIGCSNKTAVSTETSRTNTTKPVPVDDTSDPVRRNPHKPSDLLEGFMSEADSIRWLERHGYQVEKKDNGYVLKKQAIEGSVVYDVNYPLDLETRITLSLGTLPTVTVDTTSGLRIKESDSQR